MIRTLDDLEADGAALGVRIDINSPLADGGLADDANPERRLVGLEVVEGPYHVFGSLRVPHRRFH